MPILELPIRTPPTTFYRAGSTSAPWSFPEGSGGRTPSHVVAQASRQNALVSALRSHHTFYAYAYERFLYDDVTITTVGDLRSSEIRRAGLQFPSQDTRLYVQAMTPLGTFFDLTDRSVVSAFKRKVRYTPDFQDLFLYDIEGDVTDELVYVISTGAVEDPCGGFVTLSGTELQWHVFQKGVGLLGEVELLENRTADEYDLLVQLSTLAGVEPPTPPIEAARQMLAEAVSPKKYLELASEIDHEFNDLEV